MLVNEFLFDLNKEKISSNLEFKFEHLPVFDNYFTSFLRHCNKL